jgi:preprotein translocase subunit SecF
MSGFERLLRGDTHIDFVGRRRRWYTVSAVLIGVSLLALGIFGLNLGLEFRGGVAVQTENPAGAAVEDVRAAVSSAGIAEARIQLVDEGRSIRVQTGPLATEVERRLVDAVAEAAGVDPTVVSLEAVGPTFGSLVARQALIALAVFLGAAALFISWRLQWRMAGAGLAALAHDLVITVGIYAVTRFEVTPATVVALLTILGYSLYDTVVVFDRVEELEEELAIDIAYPDLVNRAMNQVLVRSLNTSLTSLLPVGSLLFVGAFIFGATTLRDFALALFVGIAAGTYSSVFIAGPLLASWRKDEILRKDRKRRRPVPTGPGVPRGASATRPVGTGGRPEPRPTRPASGSPGPQGRPATGRRSLPPKNPPRPPKGKR